MPESFVQLSLWDLPGVVLPAIKPVALPVPPVLSLVTTQSTEFGLRPYQQNLKRKIYKHIKRGEKKILCYAPTGSGKTIVMASIVADALSRDRPLLYLVHRDFLIGQTLAAFSKLGMDESYVGIIKAGYQENRDRLIQIASIQTLQRRELPTTPHIIIIDECHALCWTSRYADIDAAYPDAIKLGFTASPWRLRAKTEYFGQWFDTIALGPSLSQLINSDKYAGIERPYLVKPRYYGWGGINNPLEVDKKDRAGDYSPTHQGQAFLNAGYQFKVLQQITELCSDRRTGVIFNASVEQSLVQTQVLNEAGIETAHIEADIPVAERKAIYSKLARGEIRFLSGVGCFTEGFDVPSVEVCVLTRATASLALYVQMAGRVLRMAPGKNDCLILDFGGNVKRHGFLTKSYPITLEPKQTNSAEALKECPECGTMNWIFARVCEVCGHEFTGEGEDEDFGDDFEPTFGELLPEEKLAAIRYLRKQRKTRFTKKQQPDALWNRFQTRYGYRLENDWLFGSCFKGQDNKYTRQRFLEYLEPFAPSSRYRTGWIKFQMELEFGTPGKKYQTSEGCFEGKIGELEKLDWCDILLVERDASDQEIKDAYRQLISYWHPDRNHDPEAETMAKLVNFAYDQAKQR